MTKEIIMKSNAQKAIKWTVSILFILIVAFLLFVVIGKECGNEMALKINNYANERWGIVISLSLVVALFGIYAKIMGVQKASDLSTLTVKDIEEQFKAQCDELNEKTAALEETKKIVADMSNKMAELESALKSANEKNDYMIDILLFYVMGDSGNAKVEELKAAFGQSELLKKVKMMREMTGDCGLVEGKESEIKEAVIQSASKLIQKAKGKKIVG